MNDPTPYRGGAPAAVTLSSTRARPPLRRPTPRPGLRSLPGLSGSFAATQAAWRFYANHDALTLPQLAGPLLECARAAAAGDCDAHLLVALDWSPPHYGGRGARSWCAARPAPTA